MMSHAFRKTPAAVIVVMTWLAAALWPRTALAQCTG